jgi:hypothetical protein
MKIPHFQWYRSPSICLNWRRRIVFIYLVFDFFITTFTITKIMHVIIAVRVYTCIASVCCSIASQFFIHIAFLKDSFLKIQNVITINCNNDDGKLLDLNCCQKRSRGSPYAKPFESIWSNSLYFPWKRINASCWVCVRHTEAVDNLFLLMLGVLEIWFCLFDTLVVNLVIF